MPGMYPSNAVWAGPVSALWWVSLSAYAADGGRRLAPKSMRCDGSGGLYGGEVGILCGPGIAGGSFRILYRKSGGLATSIGPQKSTCA